jgi:ribonucleoside-diphosphate reductase alpha chain
VVDSATAVTLNPALEQMFTHKSKLSKLVPPERIDAYKKLLVLLTGMQHAGKLPLHPDDDYLNGFELTRNIYEKKYYLKDEEGNCIEKSPEQVFARLAAFIAAVEETEELQRTWAVKFYKALYGGRFLPGGRVIAGAGDLYRLKTLANCFVTLIEGDNIESIYKAAYECARTYSYGGGIGVDISCLRPRDSIVHNAADKSTGAVSFMEIYSLTTGLIGQSGRRGALMLTIDIKHPDIFYFINVKKVPNWVTAQIIEQCKWSGKFTESQLKEIERQVRENTQIRFANISLKVSDEFMQAVEEQNRFGKDTVLVYKKQKDSQVSGTVQTGNVHYSYTMPSKNIHEYELIGHFPTLEEANKFLKKYSVNITEDGFAIDKRDVFGDVVVATQDSELAIRKSGDFLLYFNSPQTGEIKRLVKARDIWNEFITGNYTTAEPGIIFWSHMTRFSPSNYIGKPIASTNPCGEVPLEDGGACNLGSVNLSRLVTNGYEDNAAIDWEGLREITVTLVRFLDNVITWNESLNPLEKQRRAATETRRVGVGIMGIADMLNQLGIVYDSDEGIALMEKVSKFMANTAYTGSAQLAEEKGPAPLFDYERYSEGLFFRESLGKETQTLIKEKGLRNIALLSIAPTGTISNTILGFVNGTTHYMGVSSGIEPIFSLFYTRRSESFGNKLFKVFHSTVQAYIDKNSLQKKVNKATSLDELRGMLPDHFFRTAHFIEPEKRVRIQGICQKYIDHSISSTVNLPEDIHPETISDIYINAWKFGLKGITIYRDGSRYPILSVEGKKTGFQELKEKKFAVVTGAGNATLDGDEVFVTGTGTLTTPYHTNVQQERPMRERDSVNLQTCPSCGMQTLKTENGCITCIGPECGYGRCEV